MPNSKRRSFTLLEIMLALLILATAAGFMGWKVKDLLNRHYFEDDVVGFYHELEVAQLCALALHSEIKIDFSQKDERCEAKFVTDEMILETWSKPVRKLKYVQEIRVNNLPLKQLTIDANGVVQPPKTRLFFSSQDRSYGIDCSKPLKIYLEPNPRGEDGDQEPPV